MPLQPGHPPTSADPPLHPHTHLSQRCLQALHLRVLISRLRLRKERPPGRLRRLLLRQGARGAAAAASCRAAASCGAEQVPPAAAGRGGASGGAVQGGKHGGGPLQPLQQRGYHGKVQAQVSDWRACVPCGPTLNCIAATWAECAQAHATLPHHPSNPVLQATLQQSWVGGLTCSAAAISSSSRSSSEGHVAALCILRRCRRPGRQAGRQEAVRGQAGSVTETVIRQAAGQPMHACMLFRREVDSLWDVQTAAVVHH